MTQYPIYQVDVGDVFMSLIHSAELNKVNPFVYLVALQRCYALAEEDLGKWMPWTDITAHRE
jgi:transposase